MTNGCRFSVGADTHSQVKGTLCFRGLCVFLMVLITVQKLQMRTAQGTVMEMSHFMSAVTAHNYNTKGKKHDVLGRKV